MANDNSAALPQFWATRALDVLFGETPILGAVNRQYDSQLAEKTAMTTTLQQTSA